MILRFTKMHGLGNDFVVINLVTQHCRIDKALIQKLSDRHLGIGCDQLLLVEPPQNPNADFFYRIFNAEGGEVEQCGNGLRCLAHFVRDNKLTNKRNIVVETISGMLEVTINKDDTVTVDMGKPVLTPKNIPFTAPSYQTVYQIDVEGLPMDISAISMGNPHAILLVDDVEQASVSELGPQIEHHVSFPNQVNAGFMEIVSSKEIKLRVFERGAGETRACGTGACAAVVAGRLREQLDANVKVHLPGGELLIEWQGEGNSVKMTGEASTVFRGQIRL